jgi:hypothetical protein
MSYQTRSEGEEEEEGLTTRLNGHEHDNGAKGGTRFGNG